MMNRVYQIIVVAYRVKINTKAFLPLNVFIGMRILVQIPHDRKKLCLIPMKTVPSIKAYIRKA